MSDGNVNEGQATGISNPLAHKPRLSNNKQPTPTVAIEWLQRSPLTPTVAIDSNGRQSDSNGHHWLQRSPLTPTVTTEWLQRLPVGAGVLD